MSGEKKYWPTSFRKFSGKQDLKSKVRRSKSRVSSVYLSNDSSTNGFVVVPEFDDPVQTPHEGSNYATQLTRSPATNGVDSYPCDLEPIPDFHHSSLSTASWDDDLSQRLGSAYEYIRSMPSATSPKVSLSSDPQVLRKQLGVPQHSVLNHPIHSSPDLPNPHTFPPQSTSPKGPFATPPNVSCATTSKKLGTCVNTHSYTHNPVRGPADPLRPAQRHTVISVPTHATACTPQSRSKLTKRRVEKLPSSSAPSSRRQVLKGVLRKPTSDTPPSRNEHTWQISLPQIRPPSPFKLDIPLHHAWHDRRTDFRSLPERHFKRATFHETKSQETPGGTEFLASLAWIGTPPMTSSSEIANHQVHSPSQAFFLDGFSMAVVVEDDSISDDALVDRLEKARRTGGLPKRRRDASPSRSLDSARELPRTPCSSSPQIPDRPVALRDVLLPSHLITEDATLNSEDTEVWQAARKALLCIREIIRTEKKYLEALKMLLNAQTATPPPPAMVPYISALVCVSETLLQCFLEDPSAWGVSTAFVTSEDELEATMVSWCAVAGAFFMDENDLQSSGLMSRWRHRKSGVVSAPTTQVSVSLSPRSSPMAQMTNITNKTQGCMEEKYGACKHSQTEPERRIPFVLLQKSGDTDNPVALTGQLPSRKLSVRDLAIQPIQRVMRYVLLYRDLLDCTPMTSPSRLLVERALEAAARIASHCDRAQRNPAFFHASRRLPSTRQTR